MFEIQNSNKLPHVTAVSFKKYILYTFYTERAVTCSNLLQLCISNMLMLFIR